MDREAVAALGASGLFRGIASRDLADEILHLGGSRRVVPHGTVLAVAGEPYRGLLVLVRGRILATVDDESGRSLKVAELRAPDAVAPAILFAPDPRLPVSLTADGRCELLLVRRDGVLDLCRRRPRFLENLLGLLGGRIQGLAAALRTARWSTLRSRLAAYLREQSGRDASRVGATVVLPHTRDQIASLIGAERPSVSRSLSAMARDGLVTVDGRRVRILDPVRLAREACPR